MKRGIIAVNVLLIVALVSCSKTAQKQEIPEFMGYIENTQVMVTTRMAGKITKIFVDEGDTVQEGDTIAQLDARELLANWRAMKSQLEDIIRNKKRLENLHAAGAVPQQNVDMLETQYNVLVNNISALNTKIEDMTVTSPIDGIVNVKVLEPGQMMAPGMPVVIVTDPQGTWARFSVPETYLDQIDLGKVFTLKTNMGNLVLQGKVDKILPMAGFATHTPTNLRQERDVRTFDIRLKIIDNQMKCKPGMSVFLSLNPLPEASTK
ncbi:MAG: HlyD family secretion protein [Bacteroidales bacterium]